MRALAPAVAQSALQAGVFAQAALHRQIVDANAAGPAPVDSNPRRRRCTGSECTGCQAAISTPFCSSEEKFNTVVLLRGLRNISETP